MDYLRTEDLKTGYGRKIILEHMTMAVSKGEIVTLIGPNGSGKSTFLKSIVRQIPMLGGCIYIDGEDINNYTDNKMASSLSVLLTERVRGELMTGFDVAALGRYPYTGRLGVLSRHDRREVWEALELVGASELAEERYDRLSDGQKQRILLARAICQEPELMVLDEPTSFLDMHYKPEFMNLLQKLVRTRGIGVLMSLHELDLAQKVSDRVICVGKGGMAAAGTAEEMFGSGIICSLYGISEKSYIRDYGTVELEADSSIPDTFVICGNGTGIPVFRQLQRRERPFVAGILWENDRDFPVASALAAEVISVPAFEPIPEDVYIRSLEKMDKCSRVIRTTDEFGTYGVYNAGLWEYALEHKEIDAVCDLTGGQ